MLSDYQKEFYINQFHKLGKMETFLEKYNFHTLTKDNIENVNSTLPIEIEFFIKGNFQKKKTTYQMTSHVNSKFFRTISVLHLRHYWKNRSINK